MDTSDNMYLVCFTTDQLMGDETEDDFRPIFEDGMIAWLEADPRNALVVACDGPGDVNWSDGAKFGIARDAGDETYWYQEVPILEPDADEMGLTVTEVLSKVLALALPVEEVEMPPLVVPVASAEEASAALDAGLRQLVAMSPIEREVNRQIRQGMDTPALTKFGLVIIDGTESDDTTIMMWSDVALQVWITIGPEGAPKTIYSDHLDRFNHLDATRAVFEALSGK